MVARGIPEEFAERVFSQIRGFGEYGFPESHAASFALLAYVTAWLKCHHPETFLCAMLNAQPMGFYAPATLIEDGARHGVITLPIDVNHSDWDCTLETTEGPDSQGGITRMLAVRMGYRYVKGLGSREKERLESIPRPVRSIEDFTRKSQLGLTPLVSLAEAGAFDSLGMTRREALWRVRAAVPGARDLLFGSRVDPSALTRSDADSTGSSVPMLRSLSVPEQVLWDYRTANHSPRGHPMAPLREWLQKRGIVSAQDVRDMGHGKHADCMGLVICRQRPGTATGVVFLTLEDEFGFVNVVVWNNVFDRYQRVLRTASLLGVRGRIQTADGVTHLIAEELYVPDLSTGLHAHKSRDFH
jgi:error-prone DNA polymerase